MSAEKKHDKTRNPEPPRRNSRAGVVWLLVMIMLGVMLILTVPALIRKKLSRVQGILLLGIYAAFCTLRFVM